MQGYKCNGKAKVSHFWLDIKTKHRKMKMHQKKLEIKGYLSGKRSTQIIVESHLPTTKI